MSDNLQSLLKEALLNNSYDYDVVHNTIKSAWMNSYSYLYFLQKANIGYEEFVFYSNDTDTRDRTKVGKLYLDNLLKPRFDVDYDIISLYTREEFRLSKFYQNTFTFEDIVYNPTIFLKMPIVIIDDKLIWDYKVKVTKDCTTFILPFAKNFVIQDARNTITDDIVYVDHKIQVLVIENIYYQRFTYNKTTLGFNEATKTFKIKKSKMISDSSSNITTSVNTEYMAKYNVKYASSLTTTQKNEIVKEVKRRNKCIEIPDSDGIMFASLHMLNKGGKQYELGTTFIEMIDDGNGYYVGTLTDDLVNLVKNQSYNIYVSMFFVRRLYKHTFYDGNTSNIADADGAKLMVLEESHGVPYAAPIPIENFMVFKQNDSSSGFVLKQNVDMMTMYYPNIYRVVDPEIAEGNKYNIYYFYYPTPDLHFTVMFEYYYRFLRDIFSGMSTEEIYNNIFYNRADLSMYDEIQKIKFAEIFEKILNYSAFHYQYGDTDFLVRYLKTPGNEDKAPIEYKDETLKSWITEDEWLLRDYVLDQKKLGASYHLFTNTLDLPSRIRTNTEIEIGDKNIYEFDEERYVFAFSNEREYPELLDCRVFVDGLLIGDVYQRRKLYMDYFYIPVKDVTDDSYIELEVFPRYQFQKEIKFDSLDDVKEITIAEPEENIYPTTADLIMEEDVDSTKNHKVEGLTFTYNKKINMIGEVEDAEGFAISEIDIAETDVAIEGTFWVCYATDKYAVYAFYDEHDHLIDIKANTVYNVYTKASSFRCYSVIPEGTYKIRFTIYRNPDNEFNPHDVEVLLAKEFQPMYNIPTRYNTQLFDITCHYDRGNFEFSSDDPSKPVKFTRLSTFDIKPNTESAVGVPFKLKFSKIPIMIRFRIDDAGYAYIDMRTDDFNLNIDYLRIFRNGRLVPRPRYKLITNYERPKLLFLEWFDVGDIVYVDVTPYRYTQIYHQDVLQPGEVLINLSGVINKPFDIRYYDVYMNGRKMSLNNVFAISPWEITLVNLKTNYNLDIYEKERDWEYFGLDYNSLMYYFSFDNLIDSGIVSDEEFGKLIKDRIDEIKDERLNIKPNEFIEEPLDYSDTDMIYPIFFIFYYDELVPKNYVNPDIPQFSKEIMEANFPEVLHHYETSSYESSMSAIEKGRKINYPEVLYLDPDVYIESTNGRDKSIQLELNPDVDDDSYTDDEGNLVVDSRAKKTNYDSSTDVYTMSVDDNTTISDDQMIIAEGGVIVYEVGHIGDVEQEILDQEIEIKPESPYNRTT